MNYYIADLHLNCKNFHESRTLEHDKIIKKNWNNVVTNADKVYVLGDIGREGGNREQEYLCEIISTLKGRKILIQGNHEKLKDIRVRQLFEEITCYKEVSDNLNGINYQVVLSHYPIFSWNGAYKGWIHLYGHTHSYFDDEIYQESMEILREKVEEVSEKDNRNMSLPYAYNVGVMKSYIDYTPRTLKEILGCH